MDPIKKALALQKIRSLTSDETDYNIWTIRITCTHEYNKYVSDLNSCCQGDFDDPMIDFLDGFNLYKFPKILCYRETSRGGKEHYHIRVCTKSWKTRKSLYDNVQNQFPFLKGNGSISTQLVQLIDNDSVDAQEKLQMEHPSATRIQKSISYVCKEHHRVYCRGYTLEALAVFEEIGSKWKDLSKLPIYKRITIDKQITDKDNGLCVVKRVIDWYRENKKDLPTMHNLQKVLTNIKINVDKKFQIHYLMQNVEFYDTLDFNLQY